MTSEVKVSDKLALSTEEAGKVANVGVVMIRKAIYSGELKAHKSGRRMIVLRSDLEQWLRQLPRADGGKSATG